MVSRRYHEVQGRYASRVGAAEPAQDLDPAGDRLRLFHGGPRFDDDRRGDPRHGKEPRRQPAAPQSGDHDLPAEPRRVHPIERLDRRPARRAHRVLRGDRDLCGRVGALRAFDEPADAAADARRSRIRRRDDDAGRPSDPAAQLSALGARLGDELDDDPGDDRADRRSDRRRLSDDLLFLARDLLPERPDRDHGCRAGALPDRELPRAGADHLRSAWFRPCRFRARLSAIRHRKPRTPDHPYAAWRTALSGGPRDTAALHLACAAARGPDPRSAALAHPHLPRRHGRPAACAAWVSTPYPFYCP